MKKIFIVAVFASFCFASQAQIVNAGSVKVDQKKEPTTPSLWTMRFGYLNEACKIYDPDYPKYSETSRLNGIYIGFDKRNPISAYFGVDYGFYLSADIYRGEIDDMDLDLRIPVLFTAGYQVNSNFSLGAFAGPVGVFTFLIGGDFAPSEKHFRPFDLGLMFGSEARFGGFSINLGYSFGLLSRVDYDDYKATFSQLFIGMGIGL